jgi:hypothetical protein
LNPEPLTPTPFPTPNPNPDSNPNPNPNPNSNPNSNPNPNPNRHPIPNQVQLDAERAAAQRAELMRLQAEQSLATQRAGMEERLVL